MSINATNTGTARELVPSGNHIARCYSMIHIGTILETVIGESKMLNKVRITWELPTELRVFKEENGEQPMVIYKEYTLSMHEKSNLRKDLESWRGKGFSESEAESFDITKLLDIPCMLSIIHKISKKNNEYATISSIAAIPKGMKCPDRINDLFEFNYDDKFNIDVIDSMPDFIKDKIKESQEFRTKQSSNDIDIIEEKEELTDDLPF